MAPVRQTGPHVAHRSALTAMNGVAAQWFRFLVGTPRAKSGKVSKNAAWRDAACLLIA